jgi:hypothetical protein
MPELQEFIDGFNLTPRTAPGFTIISATGEHNAIVTYHEYEYHLIITARGDYNNMYYYIANEISKSHVIYGIRNPYQCSIEPMKQGDVLDLGNDTYEFHLRGHSYRI